MQRKLICRVHVGSSGVTGVRLICKLSVNLLSTRNIRSHVSLNLQVCFIGDLLWILKDVVNGFSNTTSYAIDQFITKTTVPIVKMRKQCQPLFHNKWPCQHRSHPSYLSSQGVNLPFFIQQMCDQRFFEIFRLVHEFCNSDWCIMCKQNGISLDAPPSEVLLVPVVWHNFDYCLKETNLSQNDLFVKVGFNNAFDSPEIAKVNSCRNRQWWFFPLHQIFMTCWTQPSAHVPTCIFINKFPVQMIRDSFIADTTLIVRSCFPRTNFENPSSFIGRHENAPLINQLSQIRLLLFCVPDHIILIFIQL